VLQVMRGILFPNSNVVFSAQSDDPAAVKQAGDPAAATDPLASAYGGWEAVANSAIALKEATRLLEVPRSCSNGKPAPIQAVTWKKGLAQLREAGQAAYKAAQAKNQDQWSTPPRRSRRRARPATTRTAKRRRAVPPSTPACTTRAACAARQACS
jgi:hypothetical protein